ncbi:uncharacterized protein LOC111519734 isoform X1 [Drosophila willistoni]|uniref:uncharacterized protein LOC124460809 isoform X1 n=1 Tax=Drosophila willistoni TaxID=7260 RepID=UPI001F07C3EA|nr:uncharacterized protein LOC124460809 isoform X1 [Drosophila willistoni]XP_046868354.1 uncharacterized protein LOC111519734 isoform X1 [Drosophila willistoni]
MLIIIIKQKSKRDVQFSISNYETIFSLKKKIEKRLGIPAGQCDIWSTDGNIAHADLILEMPGVQDGENSDSRPVISVYDGSNYVGRLVVIEKGKETVSPVSSSLSVLEQSSDSSSESIEKCIKPQAQKRIINHDLPSENKRYKVDPTVSEESSENTSSGSLFDACGMVPCDIKSRASSSDEEDDQPMDKEASNDAPFVDILPENRPFVVVISASACNNRDFCKLLNEFFKSFAGYRNVGCLKFNKETPVQEYSGRLYVAAANESTMDWVLGVICKKDNYEAVPLTEFLHLLPARVIVPKVEKCLSKIFDMLERQNNGIQTYKWSVIDRNNLDPCSNDNITKVCVNEAIDLYMDADSIETIKNRCYQLRYLFWVVKFMFCE